MGERCQEGMHGRDVRDVGVEGVVQNAGTNSAYHVDCNDVTSC